VSDTGVNSSGKGEKTSMTIRRRAAPRSTLTTSKSCHHWREPFHSERSLAEVMNVSYSTMIRHLPDSIGIKTSICAGRNMNWLRTCVVADLKVVGDCCQSWKRASSIHFGCWPKGTRTCLR
jgi:hypothetical protein